MGEEEPIDKDDNDFVDTNITDQPETKSQDEEEEEEEEEEESEEMEGEEEIDECEGQSKFQCGSSSNFICENKKCDGIEDCPNGEDEDECSSESDKSSQESDDLCRGDDKFRCGKTSVFICEIQRCDGTKNCPDGDDEENCPTLDGSESDDGSGEELFGTSEEEEEEIKSHENLETTKPSIITPGIIFLYYNFL